jgi:hypothetical protein
MHADLNAVSLIANPSRVLREISATAVAIVDTFVTVALFSGIGLLLSLSVLILELSAWRGLSQTPKFPNDS